MQFNREELPSGSVNKSLLLLLLLLLLLFLLLTLIPLLQEALDHHPSTLKG